MVVGASVLSLIKSSILLTHAYFCPTHRPSIHSSIHPSVRPSVHERALTNAKTAPFGKVWKGAAEYRQKKPQNTTTKGNLKTRWIITSTRDKSGVNKQPGIYKYVQLARESECFARFLGSLPNSMDNSHINCSVCQPKRRNVVLVIF